jgi:hypothetical protein
MFSPSSFSFILVFNIDKPALGIAALAKLKKNKTFKPNKT